MVWYSEGGAELPLIPLGNGRLLAWEEGAALFSLRMGYSAPHILGLFPEFGDRYHELSVDRLAEQEGAVLRLYYTSQTLETPSRTLCDLQITDVVLRDQPIFLRRFDGLASLSWKLVLPSYVRRVFHAGYRFGKRRADTIFLTVPAGTPMESGLASVREQTVAILLMGELRFDPTDNTLYYGSDLAELAIICCEDPKELVREGDRILSAFMGYAEVSEQSLDWETLTRSTVELSPSERMLQTIRSQTAKDAVILASHREPYASASDLPALTEVLLQTGEQDTARRMLLRFHTMFAQNEHPTARLLSGEGTVMESGLADYSALAAYLLAVSRYLQNGSPSEKDLALLYRGARRIFILLMQGMRDGMLPFGSSDRAFEAGLMGRELLFQGSAETTALAIAAGKEYLAYCNTVGKRIAREEAGYREILTDAEARFDKNFVFNRKQVRNAPRLEAITRRPRFVRGICVLCQQEGAYPFEEALELDKYGRYLCRRCFATRRNAPEVSDPGKRFVSPRAAALVTLVMENPASLKALANYALSCVIRLDNSKQALPLREGDTDPLVLLALCKKRKALVSLLEEDERTLHSMISDAKQYTDSLPAEASELVDVLIQGVREHLIRLSAEGSLPTLLCDTAAMGGRSAAGATTLCYLALREADEIIHQ